MAAHPDPPRRLPASASTHAPPASRGAAGQSPHSLVQELLNRSPDRLWGIVSNGLAAARPARQRRLTRQAYVEFDLEAMFTARSTPTSCCCGWSATNPVSRPSKPEDCWLERWTQAAASDGTRALDALRHGVEDAIETLGGGFLAHPANNDLHDALRDGAARRARLLPPAAAARLPAAVPVRRRGPRRAARPERRPARPRPVHRPLLNRRICASSPPNAAAAASTTATNNSSS